jgi:hypothetical protein
MKKYYITNQKDLRREFWATHPTASHKRYKYGNTNEHNDYVTDTRCMWVDWLDYMQKSGEISQALAERATL